MAGAGDPKAEEAALEKYVRRLIEVQEEIGEIGALLLESSATRFDKNVTPDQQLEQVIASVNKIRIPGFCAYKLAEEGMVLLNLVAVRSLSLRKMYEQSGNSSQLEKLSSLQEMIDTVVEPLMRRTLEEMTPYSTMDSKKIVESIVSRHQIEHPKK